VILELDPTATPPNSRSLRGVRPTRAGFSVNLFSYVDDVNPLIISTDLNKSEHERVATGVLEEL